MATAQSIIDEYINAGGFGQPFPQNNLNTAGLWRNPLFDLRTEQEAAGTLDPTALYPNPQLDFSVQDPPPDPCQEGYMLVDGICQPIEQFGQSSYDEKQDDDKDDDPTREYYSIEDMEKMDDYEFLKYLTGSGAYMGGKDGMYTLKDPLSFGLFGAGMKMLGLDSRDLRNQFMRKKLAELGYDCTLNKKGEPVYNLMQPMNIISNAEAANKGVNENQISFFTPEEINYQIDAKNKAQNLINQGGNPYAKTMTEQEVIQDAIQSGGTVNPFEAQGINQPQVQQPKYTGVNPFKDEGVWI